MKLKMISTTIDEEDPPFGKKRLIEIDGIIDNESYVSGDESPTKDLFIKNHTTLNFIQNQNLNNLEKELDSISYNRNFKWCQWPISFRYIFKEVNYDDDDLKVIFNTNNELVLSFEIDLRHWNKQYSIYQMNKAIKNYLNEKSEIFSTRDNSYYFGEGLDKIIYVFSEDMEKSLKDLELKCVLVLEKMHNSIIEALSKQALPDLLTTLFEFPEEIKTSCKQYLIYFAQFLADIGINATTSIKEDTHKVLFTVVPEDETVALSKIQEALTLYLNAPTFENIGDENLNKDIAVLQWQSNIYHLKSQLALSQALLQTKDATIEALQLSNYQLKQVINTADGKSKLVDSKNEVEIIKGIMTVKKYDGKAFSVDLPEILRKLKRKFKN